MAGSQLQNCEVSSKSLGRTDGSSLWWWIEAMYIYIYMGVSKNRGGPPKSSILIGFSIINHPFWDFGVPLFSETSICLSFGGIVRCSWKCFSTTRWPY